MPADEPQPQTLENMLTSRDVQANCISDVAEESISSSSYPVYPSSDDEARKICEGRLEAESDDIK